MLDFIAVIVGKATLVLVLGGLTCWSLRRRGAETRHAILAAVVAGVLLVPLLAGVLPVWRAPLPWLPSRGMDVKTPANATAPPNDSGIVGGPAGTPATVATGAAVRKTFATSTFSRVWIGSMLGVVWASGTLVVLMAVGAGYASVERVRSRAYEADVAQWRHLARRTANDLGLAHDVRLLFARDIAVPLTVGVTRPTVLLPESARTWSEERCRLVLLHELTHVLRRDLLMEHASWIACAVYWFHPAVWFVVSRLRLERELACDEVVVRVAGDPRGYANQLVEIAAAVRSSAPRAIAAMAMAGRGSLETRVRALLERRPVHRTLTGRAHVGLAAVALMVVSAVAAMRPVAADSHPLGGARQAPADTVQMRLRPDSALVWRGAIADGDSVSVRGAMGAIVVDSGASGSVAVIAERRVGPRGMTADTRVEIIRSGHSIVVCSAHFVPSGRRIAPCAISDDWGRGSVDDNEVSFRVSVPPGVHVQLMTGLGDLRAERVRGDVYAVTGNGDAWIENEGAANVAALNGRIRMNVLAGRRSGPIALRVLHGGIDVWLPRSAGADVEALADTGRVVVSGDVRPPAGTSNHFLGRVNAGGRRIHAKIQKGDIRIGAQPD
jgi:beta-lactamase regulating signal transducer with metallopeptidase domain